MIKSRPTSRGFWLFISLGAVGCCIGCIADAQQTGSADTSAVALEEIVVTAQKRSESLQDVPISITAITGQNLATAHIDKFEDLSMLTPSLNMNQRGSDYVPYIRGIGTIDITAGQEGAVATYVDGVYISNPLILSGLELNSIERVEVLKGPQGTLFGRNATGGAINIVTPDPTQEPTLDAQVEYGNYQTSGGQIYASTGLTGSLAANVAMNFNRREEGFGYDVFTKQRLPGSEDYDLRMKLLFTPSDATTLVLAADWSQDRDSEDNRGILPGSVAIGGFTSLPTFQNTQEDTIAENIMKNFGISARLKQLFSQFDLVSISAYREARYDDLFDNDGTPLAVVNVHQSDKVETFTQEVQVLSKSTSRFTWIVGAFFMDDRNHFVAPGGIDLLGLAFPDPINGLPASVGTLDGVDTKSAAGFVESTFKIRETTRLTLGGRFTSDQKELSGDVEHYRYNGSLYSSKPTPSGSRRWQDPTWRAVVQQDIGDSSMAYASYNRGYRSGSYNTVDPTGVPINPEFVNAYEVGSKNEFLNHRVRFNADVFYDSYTNLQVVVNRGASIATLNAAKARIDGLEFDTEAALTEHLSITLSGTYLDTKYLQFAPAQCTARTDEGATIATVCNPTGNQLVRAPKFTATTGFTYTVPVSFGFLGATANYFWTDRFPWDPDNRLQSPAYGRLNGQVSWNSSDKRYTVAVYGRNLTNRQYYTFEVAQPGLGDIYDPGPPRSYGVQFKVHL